MQSIHLREFIIAAGLVAMVAAAVGLQLTAAGIAARPTAQAAKLQ
ncbi:hypothetical protein [Chelatococcus reniformis]|nr:hypothetical protein [Chelatococcus reniformis]